MKINRNSWHFRLYVRLRSVYERDPVIGSNRYFGWVLFPITMVRLFKPIPAETKQLVEDLAPRSLCGYFWTEIGLTLLTVVLWPLSVVIVVVCVAPYAVGLGIGLVLYTGYSAVKQVLRSRKNAKYAALAAKGFPEPTPSVVLQFVKAKKRRVCPLLTYTD